MQPRVIQWCSGRFDTLHVCWNDSNFLRMASQGTTDNISECRPSVCRDCAVARPATTHTQTSIQVGFRSVVGAVSSQRHAVKLTESDSRAPEHEETPVLPLTALQRGLWTWRHRAWRFARRGGRALGERTGEEDTRTNGPSMWQFRRHHVERCQSSQEEPTDPTVKGEITMAEVKWPRGRPVTRVLTNARIGGVH